MDVPSRVSLNAQNLRLQEVSVTRKMSASLPNLRAVAQAKGLTIHHLGAGYPHPEVTDPRGFIEHTNGYFEHLTALEGHNDQDALPEFLRESYAYTDTLGPRSTREAFATVYGNDWGVTLDPDRLIPTVGATGGISLVCALFERSGEKLGYLTDAPTYAGFLARSALNQATRIFSVDMDDEGPDPEQFRSQILAARSAGYFVPFYYTVPDGHNPAGISFSNARRREILEVARELGVLILEDAPYIYIDYSSEEAGSQNTGGRPTPFVAMDPQQTVHLFTGSKIGLPGPRIGFIYSDATLEIADGAQVPIADLLLTESSSDILFQNPAALRSFEGLLHKSVGNGSYQLRDSLWGVAESKLGVYRDNRQMLLEGLQAKLGDWPDEFHWTTPQAGFFSVFTFLKDGVTTDDAFIEQLVADYGVVVIPMYDFYPPDAKQRNPRAGLNQLRISFCFSESTGEQRRKDMRTAVAAFCQAVKKLIGKTSG